MDKSILYQYDSSGKFSREDYLKNHYNDLYIDIINYCNEYNLTDISFKEKVYLYKNNIKEYPRCKNPNCNNHTNFKGRTKGYSLYCSRKCCLSDTEIIEKRKNTLLKEYEVENVFQLPEIKNRIKQTNLERYGVENPQQNELIKKKSIQTNLERYGVEHVLKSEQFKNKLIETNLERYGIDNPSKLDSIKEKAIQSNLEKYGVDNPSKLDSIKNKTKQSNLIKYGVDNVSKLDSVKNKIRQTDLERYGKDSHLKLKSIRDKIKLTNLERYGVEYNSQTFDYKLKVREKYLKNIFNQIDNLIEVDNNNYHIKCDCGKDHIFVTNSRLFYQRKIYNTIQCTICNPIDQLRSGLEIKFYNFIKENYNGIIIENDRKSINPYELDIYLPELNLAFEFNGLYWHSEIYKPKDYHKIKSDLCSDKEIQLFHIYEDDWLYKNDIIKSIILNRLGKFKNIINSENCDIKEINDNNLIKSFLINNHLESYIESNINIGLFYNNELISLMTFKDNELLRFCNKLNINILNSESKLFNFYIEKYNPKNVITFNDRSQPNKELYERLGFKLNNILEPTCFYIIDGKKSNLLTENIYNYKIFNSGTYKFIYEK